MDLYVSVFYVFGSTQKKGISVLARYLLSYDISCLFMTMVMPVVTFKNIFEKNINFVINRTQIM